MILVSDKDSKVEDLSQNIDLNTRNCTKIYHQVGNYFRWRGSAIYLFTSRSWIINFETGLGKFCPCNVHPNIQAIEIWSTKASHTGSRRLKQSNQTDVIKTKTSCHLNLITKAKKIQGVYILKSSGLYRCGGMKICLYSRRVYICTHRYMCNIFVGHSRSCFHY